MTMTDQLPNESDRAASANRAEHADAMRMLIRAKAKPARIIAVYSAGDPEAATVDGQPRDTILFVDRDDRAVTAVVTQGGVGWWPGFDEYDAG